MRISCLVIAFLFVVGCGGGSSNESLSCTKAFTACGGDPRGTWALAAACPTFETNGECAITARYAELPTATLELRSDGTYTMTSTGQSTFAMRAPIACFGSYDACRAHFEDDGFESCTQQEDACECFSTEPAGKTEQGTFEIDGTELALLIPDGGQYTSFCVEGDVLALGGGEEVVRYRRQ